MPAASRRARGRPSARQWASFATVALAGAVADQALKSLIPASLTLGERVKIAGTFALTNVQNNGIAFGILAGSARVIAAATAVAFVSLLLVFERTGARHPLLAVALGLLTGGSASNLSDRVRLGHVTDYLHIEGWPAFNLGDILVLLGIATLFIASIRPPILPPIR